MGAVRWDNGPTLPWAWACSLMSGFRSLSLDFHGSVLGPGPVSRAPHSSQGPEESLHSCCVEMNRRGCREGGSGQ